MPVQRNLRKLSDYFSGITDYRQSGKIHHRLSDIILICLCGMLAKTDSWEEIEAFCRFHEARFREFLDLPYGIPSHDTLERVMRFLNPKEMQNSLNRLLADLRKAIKANRAKKDEADNTKNADHAGDAVAIDGKTLRGSRDEAKGQTVLHMVHAWSSADGLLLGETRTSEKSNEIAAIPELLETLALEKCTVTIDAMGCQIAIAQKIRKKKAHYVLGLKGNQAIAHQEVQEYFQFAEDCAYLDLPHQKHTTLDKGHGRIERREYTILTDLTGLEWVSKWKDLAAVVRVRSHRTIKDKTSIEDRFYLTSLTDIKVIAHAIRSHWGVENKLHWSLDVVFQEDKKRDRKDYAAENLAVIRRFDLTLLRADTSYSATGPHKRGRATWSIDYLLQVLTGSLESE